MSAWQLPKPTCCHGHYNAVHFWYLKCLHGNSQGLAVPTVACVTCDQHFDVCGHAGTPLLGGLLLSFIWGYQGDIIMSSLGLVCYDARGGNPGVARDVC